MSSSTRATGASDHTDERSSGGLDDEWNRAWQRDPIASMVAVVDQHHGAVTARARQICGHDRAADVTQEVFLRFWQRPERYRPSKGPLGPFLQMMTGGIAIDEVRRDARRRTRDELVEQRAEASTADPTDSIDPITTDRVHDALAALDGRQRDAVVAAIVEQLVHREIATSQGIPEGTVKSRVRLGLARLRHQLGDLQRGPDDLSRT